MASLARSLKAWVALLLPKSPWHEAKHWAERQSLLRMEFTTLRAVLIEMPCQFVRGRHRLVYPLLFWNP